MIKFFVTLFTVNCLLFTGLCQADQVYLELSSHGQRLDLGVTEFVASKNKPEEKTSSREIRSIVLDDLRFSRYFNLIEGGPAIVNGKISMPAWSELGADIVLGSKVELSGDNNVIRLTGYLYDTTSGKQIWTRQFNAVSQENTRRLAHEFANEVIRQIIGAHGIFTSKIVFSNNATGSKELYTIDFDGNNLTRLTNHHSIALLPKFSPDSQWITFTSFMSGRTEQYVMRSNGKDLKKISSRPGLNSSAAWSPANDFIALTLSVDGSPHIYLLDLEGKIMNRLTFGTSANTAPAFSQNGRYLAFTSDRSGTPQIYFMSADGALVERLTQGGYCDSPSWSPKGDLIAFTMDEHGPYGGNYDIYTIDPATRIQRRLTFGEGDNENASWSPDSNFIVFTTTRNKKQELYIMDADGTNPHPAGKIPGNSFTPNWGQ